MRLHGTPKFLVRFLVRVDPVAIELQVTRTRLPIGPKSPSPRPTSQASGPHPDASELP